MLRITNRGLPLPQKGNGPDCSRLGKRVTSAACEDGHATATGAASRQRRSRHKRPQRRCSLSSLNRRPTGQRKTNSLNLKPSPTRRNCRKVSRQPRVKPASRSSSRFAAIVTDVADAVDAAIASRAPPSRRRFPDREVRPARPRRRKSRRKPPSRQRGRLRPPSDPRAP